MWKKGALLGIGVWWASARAAAQTAGGSPVGDIRDLSPIVATYGVYAICLIFVFFVWRRATSDLTGATAETRPQFAKMHALVVRFTIVLASVATLVWIYSTFIFKPVSVARGVVSGLTPAAAQTPSTDNQAYEQIAVEPRREIDAYSVNEPVVSEPRYNYRWILVSRERLGKVLFLVRHSHVTMQIDDKPDAVAPVKKSKPFFVDKRFIVKPSDYPAGTIVSIVYEPNAADLDVIGRLYLQTSDSPRQPVAWEVDAPLTQRRADDDTTADARWLPFRVFAQSQPVFRDDGQYDPRTGVLLRQRLASGDLQTQLAARRLLVQSGQRSIKFILDSLDAEASRDIDRTLLLHNVGEVVNEIEQAGVHLPKDANLRIGRALYEVGDFTGASAFFNRAGDTVRGPDDLLKRGYSFQKINQPDKALADYKASGAGATDSHSKAIALKSEGVLLLNLGRRDDAVTALKSAAATDRSIATSLNNQAYVYALHGEKLDDAMILANQAIQLSPDKPDYLDTKGLIFFKQQKFADAVVTLEKAARLAPGDRQIAAHLEDARKKVR